MSVDDATVLPIGTDLQKLAEFARKVIQLIPREPVTDFEKSLAWTALVCGLMQSDGTALPALETDWRDEVGEDDEMLELCGQLGALRMYADHYDDCPAAKKSKAQCTCGLAALLTRIEAS